jgi:hypothetical protein
MTVPARLNCAVSPRGKAFPARNSREGYAPIFTNSIGPISPPAQPGMNSLDGWVACSSGRSVWCRWMCALRGWHCASLAVVAIAALSAIPADVWKNTPLPWLADWHWLLALVAAAFSIKLHTIATATFGRVVRYTKADPGNIAARQAVRERGLRLLNALHEGSYYKRITIVSHSLGTILAHDLLSYFWAGREAARKIEDSSPEFDALCALEAAAADVDRPNPPETLLSRYYAAQRDLRIRLASRPPPPVVNPPLKPPPDTRWLISVFITLGSPLTHADFLIASSDEDFAKRKFERELPQSPPFREDLDPKVFALAQAARKLPVGATSDASKLISFPLPTSPHIWELHHAAPFAVGPIFMILHR